MLDVLTQNVFLSISLSMCVFLSLSLSLSVCIDLSGLIGSGCRILSRNLFNSKCFSLSVDLTRLSIVNLSCLKCLFKQHLLHIQYFNPKCLFLSLSLSLSPLSLSLARARAILFNISTRNVCFSLSLVQFFQPKRSLSFLLDSSTRKVSIFLSLSLF